MTTASPTSAPTPQPKPAVSVILCGYNQSAFLKDAVDSVLNQSFRDLELIAVDNGSTDNSRSILEAYRGNPRVKLHLHEKNAFVTSRLNAALRDSSGKFISILYADDFYLPTKIENQLKHFASLPPDYGVVYSPGYRLNMMTGEKFLEASPKESGLILQKMFSDTHRTGFINPISPLIRRECYENFPYDEAVFTEGENIFFRFACKYKFSFLEEPSVVMREHESNAGKAIKKNIELINVLMQKLEANPVFPREAKPDLRLYVARTFRNCGWMGVRVYEDPVWARQCFRRAIDWRFNQMIHPRLLSGWALSFLPKVFLRAINRIGFALRRHKSVVGYKEDYV